MRLVSEREIAGAAVNFAELRKRFTGYRDEMLDHPTAGSSLRNYVILTECPELLSKLGLFEQDLHLNRYYWLARFVRVWTAIEGPDAGLEQQLFQLFETMPIELFEGHEVNHLQLAAECAADEDLRKAGSAYKSLID